VMIPMIEMAPRRTTKRTCCLRIFEITNDFSR
jgi:hypothetical protein